AWRSRLSAWMWPHLPTSCARRATPPPRESSRRPLPRAQPDAVLRDSVRSAVRRTHREPGGGVVKTTVAIVCGRVSSKEYVGMQSFYDLQVMSDQRIEQRHAEANRERIVTEARCPNLITTGEASEPLAGRVLPL